MLFVRTGSTLNAYWDNMLDALLTLDTRAKSLFAFESALSGVLETDLYKLPIYEDVKDKCPLSGDPNEWVPYQTYRSWVTAYTNIMREFNLLGLIRETPGEEPSESWLEDD